jgi:hypothetical protein
MNAKKKLQKAFDRAVIESSTSPSELSRRLEADRKEYQEGEKHEESERTTQRQLERHVNPAPSDSAPNDFRKCRSNEEATNLEVRVSGTIRIRSNLDTIESKPSGTDEYEFNKRQKIPNSTTSDNYNSSRSRPPNSSSYNADSSSRSMGIDTPPLIMKGIGGSNDANIMGIVQRKKKAATIGSQVMDEYSIAYSKTSSTKDGDVMSACYVPLVPPQIGRRGEEGEKNHIHSHSHSSNTKKNPKLLVRQTRGREEKEVKDNLHESSLSNVNIEIDSSDSGYSSGEEDEEFMVDDTGPSESESEFEVESRRQLKRKRIQPKRLGQDASRQQLKGGMVKRTRTQTLRSDVIFYNTPTLLTPGRHSPSTPRRTQMDRFGQYATQEQLEDLEQTSPSDFISYNEPDRCSRSPSNRTKRLGRRSRSRRRPLT